MDKDKLKQMIDDMPTGAVLTYGNGDVGETNEAVAVFSFSMKGVGFGEITISTKDGKTFIDSERMGRNKVKEILGVLVDQATFDTDEKSEVDHGGGRGQKL